MRWQCENVKNFQFEQMQSQYVINPTVVGTEWTEWSIVQTKQSLSSPLSNLQLCQSLRAHPSSRRPPPPAWPSPGTPATQTPSPTTSSSTEPKGQTASSRRWTASPPPATASGACTPTRSTKSECRPSIASARGRLLLGWRPAQESRLQPVLHETSRPTLFHRTQWWSAGRSRRSPMDRWDERWNSSRFL